METKARMSKMRRIMVKVGLLNGVISPSKGKSGGIAMLWESDLNVELKSFTMYHIDSVVTDPTSGFKWRIIGFYGNPDTNRRKESWELLQFLNAQFHMPWVCMGDFNEILLSSEKWGGLERPQQQIDGFRKVVNVCGFMDLGYERLDFTWCNQRSAGERIRLRLDKVLTTTEWKD